MSTQETTHLSRIKKIDHDAGIENGIIWMDAVEDLGDDYRAISQMFGPRPAALEFNPDRARVASAQRRYGMAKMLVFYDDALPRLERLANTSDPHRRGAIILEMFRRVLDVAPVYRHYAWRLLEINDEALEKLLSELHDFASTQPASTTICQVTGAFPRLAD